MIDPALVSVISATTALVASVTGPLVTIYVARVKIRASVRSANRQRWIDEFRDLIANFCGQIAAATQIRAKVFKDGRVSIPVESEFLHHFERLIFTSTKLRLMVNPLDREHGKLLAAVDELLTLFRTAAVEDDIQDEARARALRLADMSHEIIRHEWLRVQQGA